MKRIKDRWGGKFPEIRRTPQNLAAKASRFEKEKWREENKLQKRRRIPNKLQKWKLV